VPALKAEAQGLRCVRLTAGRDVRAASVGVRSLPLSRHPDRHATARVGPRGSKARSQFRGGGGSTCGEPAVDRWDRQTDGIVDVDRVWPGFVFDNARLPAAVRLTQLLPA